MLLSLPEPWESIACRCDACGHEWLSRSVPDRCSRCKSRRWTANGAALPHKKVIERQPSKTGTPPPQSVTERLATQPDRRAHDPKTCRVYRCAKCQQDGHRDPNRGLT